MFGVSYRTDKSGNRIGDIGYAVQNHAESNGFGVVRELVGHGLEDLCMKNQRFLIMEKKEKVIK